MLALSQNSITSDIAFGEADLTSCDREPIHIPGSIQPYGVLLAVGRSDFEIRQFAGDTQFLLGIELRRMSQLSLHSLFDESVLAPIADRLRDPAATIAPLLTSR
jgi:chemotaxis family two-component system sensor kinase Cph1